MGIEPAGSLPIDSAMLRLSRYASFVSLSGVGAISRSAPVCGSLSRNDTDEAEYCGDASNNQRYPDWGHTLNLATSTLSIRPTRVTTRFCLPTRRLRAGDTSRLKLMLRSVIA